MAAELVRFLSQVDVYSVACRCGAVARERLGLRGKLKRRLYEAVCNPLLQAMMLNQVGRESNIFVGLCVGHDTISVTTQSILPNRRKNSSSHLPNHPANLWKRLTSPFSIPLLKPSDTKVPLSPRAYHQLRIAVGKLL